MLCRKRLEVLLYLAGAGEDGGEVVLGLEGVRVVVRGHIASASGVSVLEPCAPYLGVLFVYLDAWAGAPYVSNMESLYARSRL